jgi:hypothetical protein
MTVDASQQETLIRRLRQDLMDSYDEELAATGTPQTE